MRSNAHIANRCIDDLGTESLANTERHLDVAKGHSQRAEDKTDELKQLNRSIFRPVITFNKEAKRAAQEAKIQQRYDEDREEREKAMLDIRETQNRLGRAATYGQQGGSDRTLTATELNMRKEQRKRYQFEATASDDEIEDEIDGNLDEIAGMTKRLKALGTAMGEELDRQNVRIGRITEKTDGLDNRLYVNTQRVRQYDCCAFAMTYDSFLTAQQNSLGYVLSSSLIGACLGVWCSIIIRAAMDHLQRGFTEDVK